MFGAPGHDHVPISRAIEASSALPGLFPPVEIDGEHYVDGALNKTLHASVALDEGVDAAALHQSARALRRQRRRRAAGRLTVEKLNQGGLPLVLSQTFRAIIHSRMKVGMEKYGRAVPAARTSCCSSPTARTRDMFFANIFSYRQRKRICALAFTKTRRQPARARRGAGAAARAPRHRASTPTASPTRTRTSRMRSATRGRSSPTHGASATVRSTTRELERIRSTTSNGYLAQRTREPSAPAARRTSRSRAMAERKRTAPHARAHSRDQPRAVQPLRRAAHHDRATIADEMNISPGNLYYHFRNKDEIIGELYAAFEAKLAPLFTAPADRAAERRGSVVPAASAVRADVGVPLLLSRPDELTSRNRRIALRFAQLTRRGQDHRDRVVSRPGRRGNDARERARDRRAREQRRDRRDLLDVVSAPVADPPRGAASDATDDGEPGFARPIRCLR